MSRFFGPLQLAGLIAAMAILAAPVRGEVFELADGGRVSGRLVNPDESPRKTYVIETLSGGRITLAADQVVGRAALSPKEAEYEKRRAAAPDTIDGHWSLAEWCRENFLSPKREFHLRRILELDSDHAQARAALGYRRVDGEWKTHREIMEARGLRWYRGHWRTEQEIEVLQRKDQRDQSRKKWYGLVSRYRDWLDGDRAEEARKAILAIDDPAAVNAINDALAKEELREVKALYIEVLGRINTPEAADALADCSLEDNDQEVRLLCLDQLKKEKRPNVVAGFIRSLRSKDNMIVNRAGTALARMGDRSAVGPLIDALVTRHKYTLPSRNPGNIGAGFSNDGSGGLSVGSQPRRVRVTHENQAVLDALDSLTGRSDFGFDVPKWKAWYAQRNQAPKIDARRD